MDLAKRDYSPRSWVDARLEARMSSIQGLGIFACQPIAAGEVIVVWGGRLFSKENVDSGLARERSAIPLSDDLYLGLYTNESGDIDEFMNHSCAPNVWLSDEVTLTAMRDIAAGEEVTLDYATFEIDPNWVISCDCGAPCCRGVVTGSDWQLAHVQAQYERGMSPYIKAQLARRAAQDNVSESVEDESWR